LKLRDRFREAETVVVIFHDHGTRYVGKMFNPDWMRTMGYEDVGGPTARDLVKNKKVTDVTGVEETDPVGKAVELMGAHDYSQIPVLCEQRIVGSLSEAHVYSRMVKEPAIRTQPVRSIMQKAFRYVDIETPVRLIAPMITPESPAVLVRDFPADQTYILTGYDVLGAI
jgi:cystathionine beta-synthase